MKVGDLVRTKGGVLGIISEKIVNPRAVAFFVELNKPFYNRTTWTFDERELEVINESR